MRHVSKFAQFLLLEILATILILGGLIRRAFAPPPVVLANIAEGTHGDGKITKLTDAAITTRHLLYKPGSDANHAAVSGAAEIPLGTIADEATAAEEAVTVNILGSSPGTLLMVANEVITQGEHVYTAASGKVQDLPAGAGTYYELGIALTASAADGDLIEVAHCVPRKTVIP